MKKQLFLTLSALLTLSGCGGGGSGAGSDGCLIYCPNIYIAQPPGDNSDNSDNPAAPVTAADIRTMVSGELAADYSEQGEKVRAALSKVREMTPRQGSVIQSTNISDGTNITKDLLDVGITEDEAGYLTWEVTYDADPADENAATGSTVIDTSPGSGIYSYEPALEFHNVFAHIDLPDGELGLHVISDYGRYSDYSVTGFYWYASRAGGDIIYGAFADGNLPAAAAHITAPALASYKGEALGMYWSESPFFFTADALLTVNFGDSPSIRGGFENMKLGEDDVAGRIDLQAAAISTAENDGGFFTGEMGGAMDGRPYAGKWGGQFYGESGDPARVIGTAAGGPLSDGEQPYSFIASYWAYQESFVDDPDAVIAAADRAFIEALPAATGNYGHFNLQTIRDSEPGKNLQQSTSNREGDDTYHFHDEVAAGISGSPDQPQVEIRYKRVSQVGAGESEMVIDAGEESVYSYRKDGINYQRLAISGRADTAVVDYEGDFSALVYSNYDGEGDSDYFAGGVWLYVPDDISNRVSFGAFMDGPMPFTDIGDRTETATYRGELLGFYSEHARNGPLTFSSLSGEAELTADFSGKTISGAFTDIKANNGTSETRLGSINLSQTTLGADGYFSGALAADTTLEGLGVKGYYSGQFYGSGEPSWVAGTAAGGSSIISGRDVYFSAVYAAKKQ